MLACRYFDGQASRAWLAAVEIVDGGLHVGGDGIDRTIPSTELSFAPATDLGPARLRFADGGLCEFDDRAAADALFARLGYQRPRAERLASRTSHAIAIAVVFVVAMAGLYRWGLPWVSDEVVTHLPRSWDHRLGEDVLQTLDERGVFRPTELPPERRERLRARFDALRPARGDASRPPATLEFRRFGVPNAFALPGDVIVLSDEIVAMAPDDDAILTVLGHESGHLAHRDAMHQLVRSTLTSIVAAWYIGDVSNAAAVIAGGMDTLSYSRDAERRADRYALDTMQANGVPTRSAAELFRRLERWRPDASGKSRRKVEKEADDERSEAGGGEKPAKPHRERPRLQIPEYLSTHPATDDRIELFERGSAPANDAGR